MKTHIFTYNLLDLVYNRRSVQLLLFYIPTNGQLRVAWIGDMERISKMIFRDIEDKIDVLECHPSVDILGIFDRSLIHFFVFEQKFRNRCIAFKYPGFMSQLHIAYEEYRKYYQEHNNHDDQKRFYGSRLTKQILEHTTDILRTYKQIILSSFLTRHVSYLFLRMHIGVLHLRSYQPVLVVSFVRLVFLRISGVALLFYLYPRPLLLADQ